MSEITIGLVCEGQTDMPVFKKILGTLLSKKQLRFLPLQPEYDELSKRYGPGGWEKVKGWCEEHRETLQRDLTVPDNIDLLIIQVDQDVAGEILGKTPRPKTPKNVGVKLRRYISRNWLNDPKVPTCCIVIATPAQATETWLVATHRNVDEAYEKNQNFLNDFAEICRRHGHEAPPPKNRTVYSYLAKKIPARWIYIRNTLSQAQVFSQSVEACGK